MIACQSKRNRLAPNAGIAIGPILFIIAILAILAAAIAAGSGSFTQGTGAESNKTKSTALVQIGENLRIGMDRITLEGGLSPTSVNTLVTATNTINDLFSPTGGGIGPPSVGMANNPAVDIWYFPEGIINGFGTGQANDVVAVLPVSAGVCAEVNNRSVGAPIVPPSATLGDFTANTLDAATGAWPIETAVGTLATGVTAGTGVNLLGVATGCVYDGSVSISSTTSPSSQYFYYQILAIQ